jgi:hypothetical protein
MFHLSEIDISEAVRIVRKVVEGQRLMYCLSLKMFENYDYHHDKAYC